MSDFFPLIVDASGTPAIKEIPSGDVLDLTGVTVKAVSINTTLAVAGASTLTGNTTVGGTLGVTGVITGSLTGNVTGNVTGTAATVTGAAQSSITSLGTLTTLTVDDITINGSTISDSADLTLDAAGDIILDADGSNVTFKDGGTSRFDFLLDATPQIKATGGTFDLENLTQDAAIRINGNDGGSVITALRLDMGAAGAATFNDKIIATELDISGNVDVDGTTNLDAVDIDGAVDMATTLAVAGTATFAGLVDAAIIDGVNFKVNGGQGSDGQVLTSTGSGVAWEDGGGGGVTFKEGGTDFTNSLMVGDDSTGTLDVATNNTGVGKNVFASITTAKSNAALGTNALANGTTSLQNVAIGHNAMQDSTTAEKNICIGYEAGGSLTTFGAANNIAIGVESLATLTDRSDNIAIGYRAIGMNDTAVISQCTAVGTSALSNTAFGGYGNVALGYAAGLASTATLHNTLIGREAGANITTGDLNICLGYAAKPSGTGTSEIVIGNNVAGKGNNTGYIYPEGGGAMYQATNATTWSQSSDERIKKNIVDNNDGLNKLKDIQVRNFEYRTEDEITDFNNPSSAVVKKEGLQLGVIAQEIEKVLPEVIRTENTGVKAVNTDNLTWYLINAVQELAAEIKKLKGE